MGDLLDLWLKVMTALLVCSIGIGAVETLFLKEAPTLHTLGVRLAFSLTWPVSLPLAVVVILWMVHQRLKVSLVCVYCGAFETQGARWMHVSDCPASGDLVPVVLPQGVARALRERDEVRTAFMEARATREGAEARARLQGREK